VKGEALTDGGAQLFDRVGWTDIHHSGAEAIRVRPLLALAVHKKASPPSSKACEALVLCREAGIGA